MSTSTSPLKTHSPLITTSIDELIAPQQPPEPTIHIFARHPLNKVGDTVETYCGKIMKIGANAGPVNPNNKHCPICRAIWEYGIRKGLWR